MRLLRPPFWHRSERSFERAAPSRGDASSDLAGFPWPRLTPGRYSGHALLALRMMRRFFAAKTAKTARFGLLTRGVGLSLGGRDDGGLELHARPAEQVHALVR